MKSSTNEHFYEDETIAFDRGSCSLLAKVPEGLQKSKKKFHSALLLLCCVVLTTSSTMYAAECTMYGGQRRAFRLLVLMSGQCVATRTTSYY